MPVLNIPQARFSPAFSVGSPVVPQFQTGFGSGFTPPNFVPSGALPVNLSVLPPVSGGGFPGTLPSNLFQGYPVNAQSSGVSTTVLAVGSVTDNSGNVIPDAVIQIVDSQNSANTFLAASDPSTGKFSVYVQLTTPNQAATATVSWYPQGFGHNVYTPFGVAPSYSTGPLQGSYDAQSNTINFGTIRLPLGSYQSAAQAEASECCPDGTWWNGTSCVRGCPQGQFWDGANCVNGCPNGQFWNGTSCTTGCPNGQYYDAASGTCVAACPPGQFKDPVSGACTHGCPSGYYYDTVSASCVQACPPGYYQDPNTGHCVQKCDDGTFKDPQTGLCTSACQPGYMRTSTGGPCVTPQQAGFFNSCQSCCPKSPDCPVPSFTTGNVSALSVGVGVVAVAATVMFFWLRR